MTRHYGIFIVSGQLWGGVFGGGLFSAQQEGEEERIRNEENVEGLWHVVCLVCEVLFGCKGMQTPLNEKRVAELPMRQSVAKIGLTEGRR